MDVFIERMVKKRFEAKDALILALVLIVGMLIVFASILILPGLTGGLMLPFFILVGVCFGGYKLVSMRNLEFEYSLTNGFVAVDKIMNRSARKRLTSFECSDIEDMGEYSKHQSRLQNRDVQTRLFASAYADGRDSWFVIVNTKKTGKTLLIFDPDERMLDAMKRFMPSHLRFEVFGRR